MQNQHRRFGRRLAFTSAEFTVDNRLALTASGVFDVTGGTLSLPR